VDLALVPVDESFLQACCKLAHSFRSRERDSEDGKEDRSNARLKLTPGCYSGVHAFLSAGWPDGLFQE
jgi:hypothetical protein